MAVVHPLFATAKRLSPTATAPEIGFIQVRRREGGVWKRAKQTFAADELLASDVLGDRFGGGEYELIGRCRRNRRITARVRVLIDGPSKPIEEARSDGESESDGQDVPAKGRMNGGRKGGDARLRALRERGTAQQRAFRLFERKHSDLAVARKTRLPLEEVRRLRNEYRQAVERALWGEDAEDPRQTAKDFEIRDERRRRERNAYDLECKRLQLAERVVAIREKELALAETLSRRGQSPAVPERQPAPAQEMRALEQILEALVAKVGG